MTADMSSGSAFVSDFRQAAPYIHYLRGKTVVLAISSHVLLEGKLAALAADIQLLSSLGVRLVLLHGTRQYLNRMASVQGQTLTHHRGWRITDATTLQLAKQACGLARFDLEALLSGSPAQVPDRSGETLKIASGNFLRAKPLGVLDGIDMGYTARVRKVDTTAIQQRLAENNVVLVSPLGHSLSGKSFSLSMDDVAQALAVSLKAEKLIFLGRENGVLDGEQHTISQLTSAEIDTLLHAVPPQSADMQRVLKAAMRVLEHGVRRVHILSGFVDGSLIQELFTREGCGTSLAQSSFMRIRAADGHDVGDIVRLITPLEEAGVLLPRSREYLENHIQEFSVLEHDCHVYGCVALKTFAEDKAGELACLVVSPDAQESGYGELLLDYVLKQAKQKGLHTLFALSTHTGDWFDERGFQATTFEQLPAERQVQYVQNRRHSQVYVRRLD